MEWDFEIVVSCGWVVGAGVVCVCLWFGGGGVGGCVGGREEGERWVGGGGR